MGLFNDVETVYINNKEVQSITMVNDNIILYEKNIKLKKI